MIDTLYISHQNFNWHNFPNVDKLTFVNSKTFARHLQDQQVYNVYTSLEDMCLKLENMLDFLKSAKKIVFVDITLEFLFKNPDASINLFNWRNLARQAVYLSKNTQGLECLQSYDKNIYKSIHQERSETPTIFVAGCSITHGTGVIDHERYGEIVAKQLDMPWVFLSKPGSSIQWAADRILQADVRADDIVLWGLTNLTRATLSVDNDYDWNGYPIKKYIKLPKHQQCLSIEYFNSPTLITASAKQILQVENFCKKIGAHLYLINIIEREISPFLYHDQSNYIDCTCLWNQHGNLHGWLDLGSDNQHPGPLQHQKFAEQILSVLQSDNKLRVNKA